MAEERQYPRNIHKQLGTSGLERSGGYVHEEFLPQLRWPRAGKIYQEMADNDPVVGAIMYMAEMLIRKADWSVSAVSDKAADKEAAEFLDQCMTDMSVSWAATINEILSMFTYGFSFHEIVYKIRRGPNEKDSRYRSKYSDGRIGWKKLPVRAQSTLHEWVFADDGDVKAFVQLAPPNYRIATIPLSKGLLFRTRVTKDNPEGKSLLRNAYRPWYFKKHIEEIEGIGIERDLAGLPTLTAPDDVDIWDDANEKMQMLRTNAEGLIKNIRRDENEGVLLPHGWELKLLSTGSSRQFDTNAIINRYDNRIAITMLSDLVLIGGDKTGSFALADTKKSMLASALEAQIQNIADVLNKYAVPKLFEYNYFPNIKELPKIKPGEIEVPDTKELALLLRAMGLNIAKDIELQNHLRRITSLPEISKKEFQEIYAPQGDDKDEKTQTTDRQDDTAENDFEQNDLAYTGQ